MTKTSAGVLAAYVAALAAAAGWFARALHTPGWIVAIADVVGTHVIVSRARPVGPGRPARPRRPGAAGPRG